MCIQQFLCDESDNHINSGLARLSIVIFSYCTENTLLPGWAPESVSWVLHILLWLKPAKQQRMLLQTEHRKHSEQQAGNSSYHFTVDVQKHIGILLFFLAQTVYVAAQVVFPLFQL